MEEATWLHRMSLQGQILVEWLVFLKETGRLGTGWWGRRLQWLSVRELGGRFSAHHRLRLVSLIYEGEFFTVHRKLRNCIIFVSPPLSYASVFPLDYWTWSSPSSFCQKLSLIKCCAYVTFQVPLIGQRYGSCHSGWLMNHEEEGGGVLNQTHSFVFDRFPCH